MYIDWLAADLHEQPFWEARTPTTWTILPKHGPNHPGLRYDALPEHQMALITSDGVPFQEAARDLWSTVVTAVPDRVSMGEFVATKVRHCPAPQRPESPRI